MTGKAKQWVMGSMAVVLAGAVVAVGQSAMQAEPTAVAVVNVQQVFNGLNEKQSIEADLKQQAQQLQQTQEQKQKEIQQMRSELDVLKPGTQNYQQQQDKVERKVVDFKAWQQYRQQKLQRKRGVEMENLYRKVVRTAGSVAEDNGYDVVLYDEGQPDFNFESSQQLSQMIQMRKVLWASDKLDITDQVQQRLNNQFTSGS